MFSFKDKNIQFDFIYLFIYICFYFQHVNFENY